MFFPDNKGEPWGKLHVPSLSATESSRRDHIYSTWPYYAQNDKPIGEYDDTLAAAVLIVEGLYADLGRRQTWHDLLRLRDKYHNDPANLIHDVVYYWKQPDDPLRPLALVLEQVAKGQITEINILASEFE